MSISLIAGVALSGLSVALHLIDDPITAGLDNIFAGFVVVASTIGVRETRSKEA